MAKTSALSYAVENTNIVRFITLPSSSRAVAQLLKMCMRMWIWVSALWPITLSTCVSECQVWTAMESLLPLFCFPVLKINCQRMWTELKYASYKHNCFGAHAPFPGTFGLPHAFQWKQKCVLIITLSLKLIRQHACTWVWCARLSSIEDSPVQMNTNTRTNHHHIHLLANS